MRRRLLWRTARWRPRWRWRRRRRDTLELALAREHGNEARVEIALELKEGLRGELKVRRAVCPRLDHFELEDRRALARDEHSLRRVADPMEEHAAKVKLDDNTWHMARHVHGDAEALALRGGHRV